MFSGSSPCLLGQHCSCSSAQLPVELSENMLQNLFLNLPLQTVQYYVDLTNDSQGMLSSALWYFDDQFI